MAVELKVNVKRVLRDRNDPALRTFEKAYTEYQQVDPSREDGSCDGDESW